MRALLQRVTHASVAVEGQTVGSCGPGLLVLLGVAPTDDEDAAERLWHKVVNLRIFDDEAGKANLSLAQVGGEALVVSQFTLFADCRRGNRPSFVGAAPPDRAKRLYEYFCSIAERDLGHVGRGVFGAHMTVDLENDGPFTVWLDTDELSHKR